MQDLGRVSIQNLRLSNRTYHALLRSGIFTISDLKRFVQNNNLLQLHLIGEKSSDEIIKALDEFKDYPSQGSHEENLLYQSQISDENVNNISIDQLKLSRAVRGSLRANGIRTIGDLLRTPKSTLLTFRRVGLKTLEEIQHALQEVISNSNEYVIKKTIAEEKNVKNWAQIVESYFQNEKDAYIYILISRFGYKAKKLEEIAKELGVTRERVRQIQEAATVRFLKHIRLADATELLEKISGILSLYGEDLSLKSFRAALERENILGEFSGPINAKHISKVDLLETLICWLNLLPDPRYSLLPIIFPVDIRKLIRSTNISLKEFNALQNISLKQRRKIRRRVYFTGGINISDATKLLSTDEKFAVLVMESLDLRKVEDSWYSLKKLDLDTESKKIPLRTAGLKMLSANPEIELEKFYDGLRRHVSRFYTSIAPINVIKYILPILGFEINNQKVTTRLSIEGVLSKSEKGLVSAIAKNGGVASFLEIAEEFFSRKLSLPAVAAALNRSPLVEKLDNGLYKIRGTEISWNQVEVAQKRQRRFSQDDAVSHGLDGVIRLELTVTSYAFLSGVVGAYKIKELSGSSWSIVHENQLYGNAKTDDAYLWGLSKLFKKLDIQIGERLELAFNTWDKTLTVEKVKNGNS